MVYLMITKITTSFALVAAFFTAIKVGTFHDILIKIKIQAMLGRLTEHRLRVALLSCPVQ